ncbi:hypothetical protein GKZ89_00675 [Bacillus mangrovi]|uniref:Uncharacterized protein n=1 Tax=Metabacillus mangrovi TaxID=1491830 RepID=A0A7X2S108_9BACI|nr:hypothetical protein [Metabacillus mangrovi]MTH51902.1 hypothetical protein [Metabacillus mangrovi]
MFLLTGLLKFLPSSPAYLHVVLVVILLLVTEVFAVRGIYFAAVNEARIPF